MAAEQSGNTLTTPSSLAGALSSAEVKPLKSKPLLSVQSALTVSRTDQVTQDFHRLSFTLMHTLSLTHPLNLMSFSSSPFRNRFLTLSHLISPHFPPLSPDMKGQSDVHTPYFSPYSHPFVTSFLPLFSPCSLIISFYPPTSFLPVPRTWKEKPTYTPPPPATIPVVQ